MKPQSSKWDRRNQENKETKPLVPRNNLLVTRVSSNYRDDTNMEIDDEDNNLKLYNHGDSITYSCDTNKTKSKTPHTLICKRRRKLTSPLFIIIGGSAYPNSL